MCSRGFISKTEGSESFNITIKWPNNQGQLHNVIEMNKVIQSNYKETHTIATR